MLLLVKRKDMVELTSIAGIMALVVFVELTFGLFGDLSGRLASLWDGSAKYGFALAMAGWIGLCVYCLRRRADARAERQARESAEQNYAYQKICDPVTGLPNRRGFEMVLDQRLREQPDGCYSVLSVEICNLDTVASVHGTEIATNLEIAISDRLIELVYPGDFLARGNHASFYFYCPAAALDESRFRIDSLIEAVLQLSSSGIEANGMRLQTFVTFGVINIDGETCRGPEWDAKSVVRRVDFAALRARQRGHEAVEVFDWGMESDMHQRAIVEGSLGNAIRTGQIVPYFQPLIDLRSRRVTGMEILARWNHPSQGTIPPSSFIPIAEDIGVLRALTLTVLRQACSAARDWPADIRLALNISPTDLRDISIVDRFTEILEETGMTASRIEVEITENALVEEAGSISAAIQALKGKGVSISIDDFGTGYSSLHHLRILPFDKLKIDQSFIKDMATNKESRVIVQAIIAMAQSLGLKTTAEGVEIGVNDEILQEFGCTVGQGFLYAKPLAAADVPAFLECYETEVPAVVRDVA